MPAGRRCATSSGRPPSACNRGDSAAPLRQRCCSLLGPRRSPPCGEPGSGRPDRSSSQARASVCASLPACRGARQMRVADGRSLHRPARDGLACSSRRCADDTRASRAAARPAADMLEEGALVRAASLGLRWPRGRKGTGYGVHQSVEDFAEQLARATEQTIYGRPRCLHQEET